MVAIIVAAAENNVIGKNNQLPWKLSGDLKYFRNTTMGHPVIMGRKTFESVGKPLPGRTNIIITRQTDYQTEGAIVVTSVANAIEQAQQIDTEAVFVTGGAEIFVQAWQLVTRIYLTRVHAEVDGDAFFPEVSATEWVKVSTEQHPADEKNQYAYSFEVWERR